MKRGYYISFGDRISVGVDSKIEMQITELSKHFEIEFIKEPKKERGVAEKIFNLLPWVDNKWDYNSLFSKLNMPDFIYIRRIEAGKNFNKFIRNVKLIYSNCRILIEIPTFPYYKEYFGSIDILFLAKDIIYRNKVKKYIDRFVIYNKIPNIPAIMTQNGVEVSKVSPVAIREYSPNEIHLIAVAQLQKHHGYERVIQGIAEYYQKETLGDEKSREIFFHIVGEGAERRKYEKLVKKLHVGNNIIFHGMLQGEKLDAIFNQCDIALSVFGLYKQGCNYSSAIKTMNYLAKGMPIISGCMESAFDNKKTNFFLQFPNNRSGIDMTKVIDFYDKLFFPNGNIYLRKEIKEYAYNNIDMSIVMQPIIEFLIETK